jgi:hypothetical protein
MGPVNDIVGNSVQVKGAEGSSEKPPVEIAVSTLCGVRISGVAG